MFIAFGLQMYAIEQDLFQPTPNSHTKDSTLLFLFVRCLSPNIKTDFYSTFAKYDLQFSNLQIELFIRKLLNVNILSV